MRIEHVAIWTHDLGRLRAFYETYFGAQAGEKYANAARQFESYFLTFESGARLEIMRREGMSHQPNDAEQEVTGYSHMAFSVGSESAQEAELRWANDPLSG